MVEGDDSATSGDSQEDNKSATVGQRKYSLCAGLRCMEQCSARTVEQGSWTYCKCGVNPKVICGDLIKNTELKTDLGVSLII